MQLIAPPLDENGNQGGNVDNMANNTGGGSSVLSNDLREQFERMQALWRHARRPDDEESEELKRKEHSAALETAVAIESEMKMWQNGIAELEAILAEEGDDHHHDSEEQAPVVPQEVVRFPNLPPIIPAEEDDIVGDRNDANHDNSTDDIAATTEL
jgi:hypothetical protein